MFDHAWTALYKTYEISFRTIESAPISFKTSIQIVEKVEYLWKIKYDSGWKQRRYFHNKNDNNSK